MRKIIMLAFFALLLLLNGCGYSESYLDERTETAYQDGFNDGVRHGEEAGYWEFESYGFGDAEDLEWACDVITSKFNGENDYSYEEYEEAVDVLNSFNEVFGEILGRLEDSDIEVYLP